MEVVSEESLISVYESILSGVSQVWVLSKKDKEGKNTVYALCITCFTKENATETKNLLIYSLTGYKFVTQDLWVEGLRALEAFAKKKGCSKIIAYTRVDRVVEIAKTLGADVDTRFIRWEV